MIAEAVSALDFRGHFPGFEKLAIGSAVGPGEELVLGRKTVLLTGQLEESITPSPIRLIQFHGNSRGVPDGISGVVPCEIGGVRPVHKLGVRVTGVRVVIKNVRRGEPAYGEGQPRNVLFARKRELVVRDILLFAAQADGLADKQVGKSKVRAP